MSDARFPAWDRSGKYLYFTASTDVGPVASPGSMAGMNRPGHPRRLRRSSCGRTSRLRSRRRATRRSPRRRRTRRRRGRRTRRPRRTARSRRRSAEEAKPPVKVTIDFDRLSQRTLALPVPADNYQASAPARTGRCSSSRDRASPRSAATARRPSRSSASTSRSARPRRSSPASASGASPAGGEKHLFKQGDGWFIAGTDAPAKAGEGGLKVGDAQVQVDPPAEWRQMYRETWRIERDFLYDPGYHGLDLAAAEKKYAPWVEGLRSRADLNVLFEEMLGELTLGHVFVGGGDGPEPPKVKGGLLGADFAVENGRYRFARVYDGESWNPDLRAPLTQPGVNVVAGEYLLAVERAGAAAAGQPLPARSRPPPGRPSCCASGPSPDGTGARDVTVVPVDDESALRRLAWIEGNRRKVDELSKGRLAYVYLPDTGTRRLHGLQPLVLRADRPRGRRPRRALERRRAARRLRHRLPAAPAHELRRHARGQHVRLPRRHLRPEGHDHQRVGRLRRRRHALVLPQGRARPARRQAHLGRPGGHRRLPAAPRRRLGHRPALRDLRPRGHLGGRERRHRAGRRGRARPRRRGGRATTPSSRRRSRSPSRSSQKHPLPVHKRPEYPNYHRTPATTP